MNRTGVVLLSVDVESWVYSRTPGLQALDSAGRKEADRGYVRDSIEAMLDLFRRYSARTTFFVLGETFEWYGDAISQAVSEGHEIGFHGYSHIAMDDPAVLDAELAKSQPFLREMRPFGFRAPFMRMSQPGVERLRAHGFRYDSSSYAPPDMKGEYCGIQEVPVSTSPLMPRARGAWRMPRDFKAALRAGEFPYGAAMLLPFLRLAVCAWIRRDVRRYGYAHVFLHNLQIVPPPTRLFRNPGFLCRNPGCLQFAASSRSVAEAILKRFTVVPIRDVLGV